MPVLRDFQSPTYAADQIARSREGEKVFSRAFALFVREAVAAGWREQEAALLLADAAEDYVIYLATAADRRPAPANANSRAHFLG